MRPLAIWRQVSRFSTRPSDGMGIVAACACAAHCVGAIWLIGVLPVVTFALKHPIVEVGITGGAVLVSAAALLRGTGWRGRGYVLPAFGAGVLLLLAGTAGPWGEGGRLALVITGAALVVTAHLLNIRAGRRVC